MAPLGLRQQPFLAMETRSRVARCQLGSVLRPKVVLQRGRIALRALESGGGAPATRTPSDRLLNLSQLVEDGKNEAEKTSTSQTDGQDAMVARQAPDATSWEAWLSLFSSLDNAAESVAEKREELKDAVRMEDFSRAAQLKRELEQLEAADVVAQVQRDLAAALKEERYEDAARLRDAGMAALQGWWVGVGENDPVGHLLHIGPEYGRYTGRVYTTRDIADLAGWREGSGPVQRLRMAGAGGMSSGGSFAGSGQVGRGSGSGSLSARLGGSGAATVGTPALEIFLSRGPPSVDNTNSSGSTTMDAAEQELVHQVVALSTTSPADTSKASAAAEVGRGSKSDSASQGTKDTATAFVEELLGTGLEFLGPMARLQVKITRDGSVSITATPPPPKTSKQDSTSTSTTPSAPQAGSSDTTPGAEESARGGVSASSATSDASSSVSSSDSAASGSSSKSKKGSSWVAAAAAAADAAVRAAGGSMFARSFSSFRQKAEAEETLKELKAALSGLGPNSTDSKSSSSSSSTASDSDSASKSGQGTSEIQVAASFSSAEKSEDEGPKSDDEEATVVVVQEEVVVVEDDLVLDVSARSGAVELDATAEEDDSLTTSVDNKGFAAMAGSALRTSSRSSLDSSDDSDDIFTELHRVPAEVEMQGRDSFLFRVLQPPTTTSSSSSSSSSSSAAGAPGGASGTAASVPVAAAVAAATSSEYAADQVVSRFDVLMPMEQLKTVERMAMALKEVADRILKEQAKKGIDPIPLDGVREALGALAQSLAAGNATDVFIPSPSSLRADEDAEGSMVRTSSGSTSGSTTSGSTSGASSAATPAIKYTRIVPEQAKTDPFAGLFIGSFGPHGPELLRLQRGLVDGEEAVLATKLTGDSNVPAGAPSFRAKIGRKYKLSARDVYPDDLGIVARYKGEGRVAQRGYTQPRWVEGELLVFASGGNPLTGNAELGFVFAVPGERRFLILLNKWQGVHQQ